MFPWLTVDEAGFPHVCLLSRAELHTDPHDGQGRVHAVLAGPTTITNLRRDPRATLVVIDEQAAIYVKLSVEHTVADRDWLGVTCTIASVKRDALPVALRPPRYLPTNEVATSEDWPRAARLLDCLTNHSTDHTADENRTN